MDYLTHFSLTDFIKLDHRTYFVLDNEIKYSNKAKYNFFECLKIDVNTNNFYFTIYLM